MSNCEEFVFTWRIENFDMLPHKSGKTVMSPPFSTKGFFNTEWCLTLRPRGNGENYDDSISCYLKRLSDDCPEDIEIDFKISINSETGRSIKCDFKKECVRYGYTYTFNQVKEKLMNKFCLVECHMYMSLIQNSAALGPKDDGSIIFPSFWKPESLDPDVFKEFSLATENQFEGLRRNIWKYPKECFARSRIVVEKRQVTCAINHILKLSETEKFYLPVLSCSKSLSMLVCLQKLSDHDMERLKVTVSFIDKLMKSVLVVCKMQVSNCENEYCGISEGKHFFETTKCFDTWNFDHRIQWSALKKHENQNLNLIFSISDGSLQSTIESSGIIDFTSVVTTKMLPVPVVSDDMFRFYVQKKFCDVQIRTRDQCFDAHKNVLCAMSPVFAAMFESGMKESTTNTVEIDDLDTDTIRDMLAFMYTGKIDELRSSSALKLYTAADKYQIIYLKETCRNFLKENISSENVTSILLLSDMHNDKELKESTSYFIYKNATFLSKQWKYFANNNPQLALEVFQDVYSKYL